MTILLEWMPGSRSCFISHTISAAPLRQDVWRPGVDAREDTAEWTRLVAAIVEDDASVAKRLLRADAGLAKRIIPRPKLYESGVFH